MRRAGLRNAGGAGGLLLAAGLILPACGCAPQAEMLLRQPFAAPSQQSLKLAGDWAYYAAEGGRQSCLLAFPLPRAAVGARAWVVYFSAADGPGTRSIGGDDPLAVHGFMIQEVGALAGRTDFVGGTVRFRNVLLAPHRRIVELDLRCDDGSEIRGRALVDNVASEVHAFERQYAADIRSLSTAETQPSAGASTSRRSSSTP